MAEILNSYTYQKGAWILHMLRRRIGDEIFFELLREFFDRHRHGTASTEDFLAAVDRVVHRIFGPDASAGVLGELSSWLFGAGHPQVEGAWSWSDGRLSGRIEQVQAWPSFSASLTLGWQVDGRPVRRAVQLQDDRVIEFEFETEEPEQVVLDPGVDLLFEELVWEREPPAP